MEAFKAKAYNTTSTPVLYLIGVPIGDANNISLHALEILKKSELLLCESRKAASRFYKQWGLEFPRDNHFEWNEHNKEEDTHELIDCILKTTSCVLMSDAGMPVLGDPGSYLIQTARESGIKIKVIPGPTACTSALALAGLGGKRYYFAGFPPLKTEQRATWIQNLPLGDLGPVVIYETPYRIGKLLNEIHKGLKSKNIFIFLATNIGCADEQSWDLGVNQIKKIIDQVPKKPPVVILYKKSDKQAVKI